MIRATLRLQFHKGFTFADAERLVPYFAALGISHVYASPVTTARPGSMHGYDVIDPTQVNPELGGEEALRRLVASLRNAGLGLIVDIVPNHMAADAANAWWFDVLEHGAASRYAGYFDIDWDTEDPQLRSKVLLPVLGSPLHEVIGAGEIALARSADGFSARYFAHVFPISDRHRREIERLGLSAFDSETPEGRQRLVELLQDQNYRLASWRVANNEINWRRFFDINELVGLRMENQEAFEDVHALVFRLYTDGLIDGVRVDHVDGLSDPAAYCRALRRRLERLTPQRPPSVMHDRPYIVVEKILLRGETLPPAWQCDGTSGYDFMEDVSAVQHDPAAEALLAQTWSTISGRAANFEPEERAARREIIGRSFTAQLESCVRAFHALAQQQAPGRDLSRAAIRRALVELLVHFPVYRSYGTSKERPASDKPFLETAFAGARETTLSSSRDALDHLQGWLSEIAGDPALIALQDIAVTRFQQLSAPIAAKSVEDTAAYRYGRLLSRNDVGFDIARLGIDVAEFHARSARRRRDYPNAMLATATHDHKRGEDVRARLAVISEMPDMWARVLPDWIERIGQLRNRIDNTAMPSAADIAMLLQMIVGAWPLDLAIGDDQGRTAFAARLAGWQEKALREAKLATDWTSPNAAYESAARALLIALIEKRELPDLLDDIVAFVKRISPAGAVNGLAQVLLKLTTPGVPDLYQGTDYWDFSLVDPDNRRPVDFAARSASLGSIDMDALLASWRDGRIKQAVIAQTLALRREYPRLFAEGSYEPIEVTGTANHLVAFARRLDSDIAIIVVPRLAHALLGGGDRITFDPSAWNGSALTRNHAWPVVWRNIFGVETIRVANHQIEVKSILGRCPVALLIASH